MANLKSLGRKIDRLQQKNDLIAFLVSVFKKYGDDQAGTQAALLTYYGFVSLFPLLLVFFTILGVFVRHYPTLENSITNSVLHYFPVAAQQLQQNIHGLHRSSWSTLLEIVIFVYGARGIANAMQNACSTIWQVPKHERPGFPKSLIRSIALMVLGGLGFTLTSIAVSYATVIARGDGIFRVLVVAMSLLLNFCVFMIVFRLATPRKIQAGNLVAGAIVAAVFWQVLQVFGGFLVLHEFRSASAVYGIFALVLGILFWFYLQAQMTLYALEIDVVKVKKLWPRDLFS